MLRQRLGAHEHPEAVADALRAVPRSRPFEAWAELGELEVPAVVVASRDEADPEHPYAVGERYAEAIPGAELRSEEPGASPMAWQGSQLSAVIAELGARAEARPGAGGGVRAEEGSPVTGTSRCPARHRDATAPATGGITQAACASDGIRAISTTAHSMTVSWS